MPRSSIPTLLLGLALVLGACGSRDARAGETEPARTEGAEDDGTEPQGSPEAEGSGGEADLVVSGDPCSSDADCAPVECCHASACGAAASAPSCGDAMCTMECRIGTIDCGGGCLCHEGRCAARLMRAPAGVRDTPQ